jgi:hypothetical protein
MSACRSCLRVWVLAASCDRSDKKTCSLCSTRSRKAARRCSSPATNCKTRDGYLMRIKAIRLHRIFDEGQAYKEDFVVGQASPLHSSGCDSLTH